MKRWVWKDDLDFPSVRNTTYFSIRSPPLPLVFSPPLIPSLSVSPPFHPHLQRFLDHPSFNWCHPRLSEDTNGSNGELETCYCSTRESNRYDRAGESQFVIENEYGSWIRYYSTGRTLTRCTEWCRSGSWRWTRWGGEGEVGVSMSVGIGGWACKGSLYSSSGVKKIYREKCRVLALLRVHFQNESAFENLPVRFWSMLLVELGSHNEYM